MHCDLWLLAPPPLSLFPTPSLPRLNLLPRRRRRQINILHARHAHIDTNVASSVLMLPERLQNSLFVPYLAAPLTFLNSRNLSTICHSVEVGAAASFSLPINNPFVTAFSPSNETRSQREGLEGESVRVCIHVIALSFARLRRLRRLRRL